MSDRMVHNRLALLSMKNHLEVATNHLSCASEELAKVKLSKEDTEGHQYIIKMETVYKMSKTLSDEVSARLDELGRR